MKTDHQRRIELFMHKAGQVVEQKPIMADAKIRLLRAKLILEEALETVHALGFIACCGGTWMLKNQVELVPCAVPDMVEIVDGCCDLSVVTIGTLSAFGVKDEPVLRLVDENNLEKITKGKKRADGKWLKPKGHKPPDIMKELVRQGYHG